MDTSTTIIAGLFLVAVINLPLIYKVVTFMFPLAVNGEATGFKGRYWRWKLTHVTGRVLATNTIARTYGSGSVQGNVRVTTNVHETFRLQLADGRQTNAEVVNYNVSAQPDDIISVWNVQKGGKWFTIAVLNHTTNQQHVNNQDVFQMLQSMQVAYFLGMVMAVIPTVIIAVFSGSAPAFILWFVLVALYAIGQKRIRSKFAKSGIKPIWQQSRSEAQPLLWSRSSEYQLER